MKVSFDFDSTLSKLSIQKVAKKFIDNGDEVWITTSRHSNPQINFYTNDLLFEIAENLGIKKEHIQFTEGKDKFNFLEGFDLHFDDDVIEIELIEENLKTCEGILV